MSCAFRKSGGRRARDNLRAWVAFRHCSAVIGGIRRKPAAILVHIIFATLSVLVEELCICRKHRRWHRYQQGLIWRW